MKRFKSVFLFVAAFLLATTLALPVHRAEAQSSASLSIVPKKNYTIEPGKTIRDTFTIRNIDRENPLDLSLKMIDFTFNDDGGSPKLMLDSSAPQTAWSLKPYIKVPETVSIPAGGSKTLDLSITIPENLGAGSLYSAIMYSSSAPDGGNVGLSASGVTLVFVNIPGEVNEKLTLEKFGAYVPMSPQVKTGGYHWFFIDEPKNIGYTLKNEGNVTEAPVGNIKLRHMFGQEISIDNINPESKLALIGQTRTFDPCIKLKSADVDFNGTRSEATTCADPGLWPGLYTGKIDIFYGQNGNRTQEITGTMFFWYMPAWFILVMIAVIAALTYFIWRVVSKVRRRRERRQVKRSFTRR